MAEQGTLLNCSKRKLGKMNSAIITGATSGIGLAIAKKLIKMDYVAYGIGRDFSKVDFKDQNFITSTKASVGKKETE